MEAMDALQALCVLSDAKLSAPLTEYVRFYTELKAAEALKSATFAEAFERYYAEYRIGIANRREMRRPLNGIVRHRSVTPDSALANMLAISPSTMSVLDKPRAVFRLGLQNAVDERLVRIHLKSSAKSATYFVVLFAMTHTGSSFNL